MFSAQQFASQTLAENGPFASQNDQPLLLLKSLPHKAKLWRRKQGERVATKSNKTALSPKQRKAAQMLANPDYRGTVTALCLEVGVARSTFYDWVRQSAFTAYLTGLIESYADSELAHVWQALIAQCLEGNVRAIELYFKLRARPSGALETESRNNLLEVLAASEAEESEDDALD